jgi:RNA polymerase sigma-70 factor (ECF subfamily)
MPPPFATPSPDKRSLAQLLDQFRAGDEAAAFEIYDRYQHRLLALARKQIGPHVQQEVDPESIVNTVFRAVMKGLAKGKYELPENGSLWSLMAVLTSRKISKRIKKVKAAKRGGGVESHEKSQALLVELASREPTPDEAVAFAEQLQVIRSRAKPDTFADLERRLEGYTISEIAELQEVSRWTIRRRLNGLKDVLRGLFGDDVD